jgi:hypothetical protein
MGVVTGVAFASRARGLHAVRVSAWARRITPAIPIRRARPIFQEPLFQTELEGLDRMRR